MESAIRDSSKTVPPERKNRSSSGRTISVRPSGAKQVANNHNRNNNATVSTQMSWNYDPLSAGKYSITSQFPLLVGQLRLNSFIAGIDLPLNPVIRSSLSLQDTYPEAHVVDHQRPGIFQSFGFNFMTPRFDAYDAACPCLVHGRPGPGLPVRLTLCDVWCITHFYWILRGVNALLLQHPGFMRSRCYSDFGNVCYLMLDEHSSSLVLRWDSGYLFSTTLNVEQGVHNIHISRKYQVFSPSLNTTIFIFLLLVLLFDYSLVLLPCLSVTLF